MIMAPGIDDLREQYVAVGCYVKGGTRAARQIGPGCRVLFVAASDGREIVVYDTVGHRYRLEIRDVAVQMVYDETGKKCRYEFDEESGHLMVLSRAYVDEEGDDVEEWLDCFPWQKYAPEASVDVQRASGGDSADFGFDGTVLSAPERVF